jgi:hypothetical protein
MWVVLKGLINTNDRSAFALAAGDCRGGEIAYGHANL